MDLRVFMHILAALLLVILLAFGVLLYATGHLGGAILSVIWGVFGIGTPYFIKVVDRW